MTFSGKFVITRQDNIHYNYFRIKRKLIGLAIMTFLILALMLALVRYAQGISLLSALLQAFAVAVLGTILMVGFSLVSVILRVNTRYRKGEMGDFTVHYIVDKNGVHVKSERGDSEFSWKQIQRAQETQHAIYLIAGESRAVVIPKGQIVNDGELNALRALFRKYVTPGRIRMAR